MIHPPSESPGRQPSDFPDHRARLCGPLLLVAVLLFPPPMWAATITVDTGTGCTLVDAVTAANTDTATGSCPAGSGADTIELTADVTLTVIDNLGAGGNNGLPVVASDITVDGSGYTVNRVSANDFRFFQVQPTGTLKLDDVTLTGGATTTGGALRNNGGTLILTNTTVSGNAANSGGAVYLYASAATLYNSTLSGNSAVYGGGLYVGPAAAATLNGGELSDNTATYSGGGLGGLFFPGSATLDNTTITGNTATYQGGGVYVGRDGTVDLHDSTVSYNVSGDDGGGIRVRSGFLGGTRACGSLIVETSTVANNMAVDGGGLHIGLECEATLTNTTISTNEAEIGGGLFVSNLSYTVLTNTTVAKNEGAQPLGGFFFDSFYIVTSGSPTIVTDGGELKNGGFSSKLLNPQGVALENSLVSNFNTDPQHLNCNTPFTDNGSNQVNSDLGTFDSCAVLSPLTGLEAALADNGGPTQTHAACNSSGRDQAGSCYDPPLGVATDQRGFDRDLPNGDGICDIGAYEARDVAAECRDVERATCTNEPVAVAASEVFVGDATGLDLSLDPPGPFGLGATPVVLTAVDQAGELCDSSCDATVTLIGDDVPPVIACNAPAVIALIASGEPPVSFTATATDDCSETVDDLSIVSATCAPDDIGCAVSFLGATVTISEAGPGDRIEWQVVAVDAAGNEATTTCEVSVPCLVILDEETIDNDISTIEEAARSHGVAPDYLINDDRPTEEGNPPLRWNTMFPGDVVLLPGGEADDAGWFELPETIRYADDRTTDLSDEEWIQAFVDGTLPQDLLDKVRDVMPLRNPELLALVGRTCTAIVYDSDISINYDPLYANLQGARYGTFTFRVITVEAPGSIPESQSSTSLYDLWLEVLPPAW